MVWFFQWEALRQLSFRYKWYTTFWTNWIKLSLQQIRFTVLRWINLIAIVTVTLYFLLGTYIECFTSFCEKKKHFEVSNFCTQKRLLQNRARTKYFMSTIWNVKLWIFLGKLPFKCGIGYSSLMRITTTKKLYPDALWKWWCR